ncbi:energy transducer TonB [Flavobacterium sp.]|uniref:energy transducer TonB n=1 Tax=Flavobacterium sp. TaxID=239 RepID=UPI002FDDF644
MKWSRLLLFFFFPLISVAQIDGEDEVYLSGDRIDAKFNGGGLEKFNAFIDKEFDNSKVTKSGTMVAAFTIGTDGTVNAIKIVQMLDVESAKEMIRVLKKCPKWEPAKRGGKPVSIEMKYPMTFTIKEKASPLTVIPSPHIPVENGAEDNNIYNTAGIEKKPDFPGGLQEFYNYVGKNFKVPNVKDLKGKIFATFVVEKDGSITDVKVIRDMGYGTKEEAIRVLTQSPKWIPGEQSGKKVRVIYSLPISIQSK